MAAANKQGDPQFLDDNHQRIMEFAADYMSHLFGLVNKAATAELKCAHFCSGT